MGFAVPLCSDCLLPFFTTYSARNAKSNCFLRAISADKDTIARAKVKKKQHHQNSVRSFFISSHNSQVSWGKCDRFSDKHADLSGFFSSSPRERTQKNAEAAGTSAKQEGRFFEKKRMVQYKKNNAAREKAEWLSREKRSVQHRDARPLLKT